MRSMSKLALLVGAGFPLMLAASSASAQATAHATATVSVKAPAVPAPAAPTSVVVAAPAASVVVAPPPVVVVKENVAVVEAKPAPLVDGKVEVHIHTKELVTIEHRASPNDPWETACETPCDARLPAGDQYRVVGEGVNPSETFALTSPTGDVVTIHVAPGLKKRARIGEALTIGGAVVFVGAAVIGLVAANPQGAFSANGATDNYNWDVIAVGTGIALAGLTTAIFGGSWWYNNASTRVAGDVQADQPTRGSIDNRYQTGMRMNGPAIPTYSTSVFSTSF
jgi:hypothetical protein